MKIPVHHYIDVSEKTVLEVIEIQFFAFCERYITSKGDKAYLVEVWA